MSMSMQEIYGGAITADRTTRHSTLVVQALSAIMLILTPGLANLTFTGTGTASFTPDEGTIEGLTAVATPPAPPVVLPHGMFSFTDHCTYDPGQHSDSNR